MIDVPNKTNLLTNLSETSDRLKRNIQIWKKKQNDAKLKNNINNLTVINNKSKRSWAEDLIVSFNCVACYDQPIPASKKKTKNI